MANGGIIPNPYRFVKELSEREVNNPEGAGFDLCVEGLWLLPSESMEELGPHLDGWNYANREKVGGSLTVDNRRTAMAVPKSLGLPLFEWYDDFYYLEPHRYYLITTIEEVAVPADALGLIWPRTTLMRSGVTLETGVVNPGYEGPLTMGIMNHGPTWFRLEPGARFCHILFFPVDGQAATYRGQWQGGRVSQPENEAQV